MLGSLDRGGVETWLLDLLPHLEPSEWQFDFCTLGPAPGRYAEAARARGSRVIPCPLGARRDPGALLGFAFRLYRLFHCSGYAVVHSHVHYFSSLVLSVARAAGVRVRVAHSHNTSDGETETCLRRLYRAVAGAELRRTATLALACSSDSAWALFGPGAPSSPPVWVTPYGVGDPFFRALDPAERNAQNRDAGAAPSVGQNRLRRALGLAEGAAVVGHVGRFERQKNHDFLIDLAAAAKSSRPALRWLLVGEGPLRREIESKAAARGLSHLIVFGGHREDVPRLMSDAMDVLVLPSLHEGLPLALLEAQASGLRSLVSATITREAALVQDAVEYLPLSGGPEAWAERLMALLALGRLSTAEARRRLEFAGFTLEGSLAGLLRAYASALGRPGDTRASVPQGRAQPQTMVAPHTVAPSQDTRAPGDPEERW